MLRRWRTEIKKTLVFFFISEHEATTERIMNNNYNNAEYLYTMWFYNDYTHVLLRYGVRARTMFTRLYSLSFIAVCPPARQTIRKNKNTTKWSVTAARRKKQYHNPATFNSIYFFSSYNYVTSSYCVCDLWRSTSTQYVELLLVFL